MAKDSTGTILLLGAAGVAAYGWYAGWFSNLLPTTTTAATRVPAPPVITTTAPAPIPPLGTKVSTVGDALAQIKAGDAYVLPDPATFSQLQGVLPGGYKSIGTTDNGNVLLRQDVYDSINDLITGRLTRATAAGADAASIQAAALTNLDEIKQRMTGSGLTGLGDFRRHMWTRTGRA